MKQTEKIFNDKDKLLNILNLRLAGWTLISIANLYQCDRQSVRYHCRKYQIFPTKTKFTRNSREVFNPQRIVNHILIDIIPRKTSNWVVIDGERINNGRSYADYLK